LDELNYPPLQASEPSSDIQSLIIDLPVGGDEPYDDSIYFPGNQSDEPRDGDNGDGGQGGNGNGRRKTRPRKRTSRIITYVYPDDALLDSDEIDAAKSTKRTVTEHAGIALVIENEKIYHREAIDTNVLAPNHPGYDLESTDMESGLIRFIEVKSLSGYWDSANPILMTKTEFKMAQEKGDEYWLYIVERATSEDFQIHCIQNPANRAQYYLYDHGWEPLAQ
jgi:hypothetical protein